MREPSAGFCLESPLRSVGFGDLGKDPRRQHQREVGLWEVRARSVECGHLSPPSHFVDLDGHLPSWPCELGDEDSI